MNPGSDEIGLVAEEKLRALDKRLKQIRREAKEISEQAKSGVDVSSLRERLNELKERGAQARHERDSLKRLASGEPTSHREQLLRRRENLRKNLENVDKTLSLRQAGKHRLRQLREKYGKELQEVEMELESIAADR